MEDFIIPVGKVEEWQMTNDVAELDNLFQRARRVLVGGGTVALVRELRSGEAYRFEEFTNLDDFEEYKKNIYKLASINSNIFLYNNNLINKKINYLNITF